MRTSEDGPERLNHKTASTRLRRPKRHIANLIMEELIKEDNATQRNATFKATPAGRCETWPSRTRTNPIIMVEAQGCPV
eukprot:9485010-Pyramimonas_sp.AAC.1